MSEPRMFTVIRHFDASGVSGTGCVMDGIVFHTGQVVVCWRSDLDPSRPGHSSLCIYPSWEAFTRIHMSHILRIKRKCFLGRCGARWKPVNNRPTQLSPRIVSRPRGHRCGVLGHSGTLRKIALGWICHP
jgi:hypothetical protein